MKAALAQIRADARQHLRGNWGKAILACLIIELILIVVQQIPLVKYVVPLIIQGALSAGLAYFFIRLQRSEDPPVSDVFQGFNRFGTAFGVFILKTVFTLLWTLLFIIPGIIAVYRYAMAFYIMMDDPTCTAMEAIDRSKEMMRGNKWRLFLLQLSFIGWALLAILTLGIGMLWLAPYVNASTAQFYEYVKQGQ